MRNAGLDRARQFSWPASARALLGAYTDALHRGASRRPPRQGLGGMRIGVDTRELMGTPTGVGRYLAELLGTWADQTEAVSGRHEFVLYGPAALPSSVAARVDALRRRFVWCAGTEARPGNSWLSHRPQPATASTCSSHRVYRADPPAGPLVLTIHDLSFFAHPSGSDRGKGSGGGPSRAWQPDARRSSSRTRSFPGRRSRRISACPLRASASSSSAPARRPTPRPWLPSRRCAPVLPPRAAGPVCGIGVQPPPGARPHRGISPRARQRARGKAGHRRREPHVPHQDLDALCRASGAGDRIRVRSYVPEAELADAFRRASVFAFLSEYEGFGLPPLEALASGIPPFSWTRPSRARSAVRPLATCRPATCLQPPPR